MSPRNPIFGRSSRRSGKGPSVEALQEEIRRLQQSVETLSILNDLAVAMSRAADPEEAVEKLVDRSMRAVDAEQAAVTLLDRQETAAASPMETQVRVFRSSANHESFHVNQSLLGWMMKYKKPLVINDPAKDERFKGLTWDDTIGSVMCLPLMLQAELIGVLTIYNKRGQTGFADDDDRLASIIAAQAAHLIDNARLAKDKNRMEEQLQLATNIQANLLPKSPPRVEGYDIAGRSDAALSVGGDYYDFIPIDECRHAVCLGDVSGKGLPASLLMANVQATLRALTLVDAPVNERINRANKLLCGCTDDESFVTLWYGVLDSAAHEIDITSAGHEYPFLVSADGAVRRLESNGLALGVFDHIIYEKVSVSLQPGDVLVLYSDGVTDAVSETDEQFGAERLESLIAQHRAEPAHILIERILAAVNDHEGNAVQFDDLTLVVVKRTG